MKTYPVMLNVEGRLAVVVGGGPVGLRKVQSLLQAGACVRLVAPRLDGDDPEGAEVIHAPYDAGHLAGAFIVFACTDDRELNSRIARDARSAGAWVNAADQPEDCDFFVPAVVSQGPVQIAIGTGGSSPALAGSLKQTIASALPEGVGAYAQALADLRDRLQATVADTRLRCSVLRRLVEQDGYETFRAGGAAALNEVAARLLEQERRT